MATGTVSDLKVSTNPAMIALGQAVLTNRSDKAMAMIGMRPPVSIYLVPGGSLSTQNVEAINQELDRLRSSEEPVKLFENVGLNFKEHIPVPAPGHLTQEHIDRVAELAKNGPIVINVVADGLDIYDAAMINSADKASLANIKQHVNFETPGGIDLSQQDSAIHIERDPSGGVKVNVDKALIARIQHDGMPELVPVIIGMTPADSKALFGVEVSI